MVKSFDRPSRFGWVAGPLWAFAAIILFNPCPAPGQAAAPTTNSAPENKSAPSERPELELANNAPAVKLSERPPLSLADVISVMNETADILRNSPTRINSESNRALRDRLDAMTGYIRAVDDTNPTLPYYQWHYVDRSKVSEVKIDTDLFRTARALPGVTAISLKVIRGDVRVERVRIYDKDGTAFEFNLGKDLPADSPRREICMLETEIELDRVEISYRGISRQEAKAPRLILEAGISSVPEYARRCNYELRLASKSIEQKDFASGEKHMREASKLLSAYIQSRRM